METGTVFKALTIDDFLGRLAREVPTLPGGGCAAALGAGMTAALLEFVARISARRSADPETARFFEGMVREMEASRAACLAAMDQDADAYRMIIDALHLDPEASGGADRRRRAVASASIMALAPPMAVMEAAIRMLRLARTALPEVYPPARADALAAVHMAHACLAGALAIAEANLPAIDDGETRNRYDGYLRGLREEGEVLRREIPVDGT